MRIEEFRPYENKICIVPNYRMIDRVSTELADAYKAFLQFVVDSLDSAEEEYFFLIHESISDEALIKDLRLGRDPAIVMHHNPLIIKAVIGDSRFLIGSRYHALVSGLSQGVPSLGTGFEPQIPYAVWGFWNATALPSGHNGPSYHSETTEIAPAAFSTGAGEP